QDIVIEYRPAEGTEERLPDLAAELVGLPVDVVVAETWPAIRAAQAATSTIPIVMAISSDPVQTGIIASLAHPGGNLTGLTTLSTGLAAKRLGVLRDPVPGRSKVGVLVAVVAAADKEPGVRETQAAARTLNLELQTVEIRRPAEFESALDVVAGGGAQAFIGLCDPVTLSRRKNFVDFEAKSRLPGMYETREYV